MEENERLALVVVVEVEQACIGTWLVSKSSSDCNSSNQAASGLRVYMFDSSQRFGDPEQGPTPCQQPLLVGLFVNYSGKCVVVQLLCGCCVIPRLQIPRFLTLRSNHHLAGVDAESDVLETPCSSFLVVMYAAALCGAVVVAQPGTISRLKAATLPVTVTYRSPGQLHLSLCLQVHRAGLTITVADRTTRSTLKPD